MRGAADGCVFRSVQSDVMSYIRLWLHVSLAWLWMLIVFVWAPLMCITWTMNCVLCLTTGLSRSEDFGFWLVGFSEQPTWWTQRSSGCNHPPRDGRCSSVMKMVLSMAALVASLCSPPILTSLFSLHLLWSCLCLFCIYFSLYFSPFSHPYLLLSIVHCPCPSLYLPLFLFHYLYQSV